MRYVIFPLFLVASCGDGPPLLVTVTDMVQPAIVDLAQSPQDMAQLVVDMAQSPPPACSSPKPGVYSDILQIVYAPLSNPSQVSSAQSFSKTIVYNDGTIKRPSPAIPTPLEFHCDFTEKNIDPVTCMAPCCAGQAGSPTFYFDSLGWAMAIEGSCTFQTTSAISYSATVIDGAGSLVH